MSAIFVLRCQLKQVVDTGVLMLHPDSVLSKIIAGSPDGTGTGERPRCCRTIGSFFCVSHIPSELHSRFPKIESMNNV